MSEAAERARALWSGGNYPQIAARFEGIAQEMVEAVATGPGIALLDVATGTGNVALAAARQGAEVTGVDVTPRMLQLAAERSHASGVPVTWVEAEASDLPLDSGTFDVVTSCMGVIFAPDPPGAAAELARVLRPGGNLVLASWIPDRQRDRIVEPIRRRFSPPDGAPDPDDWGRPDVVTALLKGAGFADVKTAERPFSWAFSDADSAVAFFSENSPLHAAALAALPDAERAVVREELRDAIADQAGHEIAVSIDSPWMLVTATR